MLDTYFNVNNKDLEQLSAEDAVELFRQILWAEAARLGIASSWINVPSRISVGDGGIDAEVKVTGNKLKSGSGLIEVGENSYQIKTGSFSLSGNTDINEILFKEGSTELKPRVKSCLDANGCFSVILFGNDNPDSTDNGTVNRIKTRLTETHPEYTDPRIRVYRQNNIIQFLQPFPSLRLTLLRRQALPILSHSNWSQLGEMSRELHLGSNQEDYMARLQEALRENNEPIHIRIIGEPGLGKTRLVLEATRVEDLLPQVVYCASPKQLNESGFLNVVINSDNNFHSILIVDECDMESMRTIWNTLVKISPRIKLITIYNEFDDFGGKTRRLDPPLLDDLQIMQIIQDYGIPSDQSRRWPPLCGGSPRVAHVLGQNLKHDPDNLLASGDMVDVWNRYIAGPEEIKSEKAKKTKVVLRWLSLFKKFSFGHPYEEEAKIIAAKIEKDHGIPWGEFCEIVLELKARKILQGENTLYITPKLLHIQLWSEWWENYGGASEFKLEEFIQVKDTEKSLSKEQVTWFCDMFRYAKESKAATRLVKELLGPNGPFQNSTLLKSELGGDFFLALTEADPFSALRCLEKTIGKWSKEELLNFNEGRRDVIWALERIVIWKAYCVRGAKLLAKLAMSENETWSNNATGTFIELFSLGAGPVAPTESPPSERLLLIDEMLHSEDKEYRMLGIKALNHALDTRAHMRMLGAEHQGLKKEPELWKPKTYGELFDAYRKSWKLLFDSLDILTEEEKSVVVNILLERSRGLIGVQNLSKMVIDTLNQLKGFSYIDKKEILKAVISILHYDGNELQKVTREALQQLESELTGDTFSSLLKRFAGMDLLEDKFDEDNNRVDKVADQIEELAKQALANPSLLSEELSWLLTEEAQNGFRFGYALSKLDTEYTFLPVIIAAYDNIDKPTDYFLGGYLRALAENDRERCEVELEKISQNIKLLEFLPLLSWRAGLTDQSVLRIVDLIENKKIKTEQVHIFGLGSEIGNISEPVFHKLIRTLLSQSTIIATSIALDLYSFYYKRGTEPATLPENLTMELLTHSTLQGKVENDNRMDDYHWAEISKAFIQQYPKNNIKLAMFVVKNLTTDYSVFDMHETHPLEVLSLITRNDPRGVWEIISPYLSHDSHNNFQIEHWLRGDRFSSFDNLETTGALILFPPELIWQWVDIDPKIRAHYIASVVPKTLVNREGRIALARELLVLYGEDEEVRNTLMVYFGSEGWSGPASLHYQKKKDWLLEVKEKETNSNVKLWIDEYVESLNIQIEREKIREERRDF